MKEIVKSGGVLFGVVCMAVSMLVCVNQLTAAKIKEQQQNIIANALENVLPDSDSFSDEVKGTNINYFKGFDKSKQINGYAFVTTAKGYGGDIVVMTGIDIENKITGVSIVKHSETPGLGSKINEVASSKTIVSMITGAESKKESKIPWFCRRFEGLTQSGLFVGNGGIESITGATISSKAVTEAVKDGILKFKKEI